MSPENYETVASVAFFSGFVGAVGFVLKVHSKDLADRILAGTCLFLFGISLCVYVVNKLKVYYEILDLA